MGKNIHKFPQILHICVLIKLNRFLIIKRFFEDLIKALHINFKGIILRYIC